MTKSFEENAMKNRRFGREKRAMTLGLSALALSALSGLIGAPLQAQERQGSHQSGETQGATVRSANPTIQRIIENSNLHFQAGEESFKDGNFDRARREYDRAIDVILEAGLDIRTDSHLRHHYETIVENIFQRQMTLMVMAPSAADPEQKGSDRRPKKTSVI